jgi:hypothetical protein
MTDKPRLLWVSKYYDDESSEFSEAENNITSRLESNYDLCKKFDISQCGYSLGEFVKTEPIPFFAMVTHLEPNLKVIRRPSDSRVDSLDRTYGRSKSIITIIKTSAQRKLQKPFCTIAYTGMMYPVEAKEIFIKRGPIDFLVFKKDPKDWEKSYEEIFNILKSFRET